MWCIYPFPTFDLHLRPEGGMERAHKLKPVPCVLQPGPEIIPILPV